jgi:hypothetical protein
MVLSTMVSFLLGQPTRSAEREHRVRLMLAAPLPKDSAEFMERFRVPALHAAYGSTEVSAPIVRHPDDELVSGYCGRVRAGFDVRLVDEHDREVPVGEVGEVLVRTDQPWMLTAGYVGNPDATAASWRNGWFHTGDAMRRDEAGRFYFVDRIKDAVRRRGENVSSYEVEVEVGAFPGVAEGRLRGVSVGRTGRRRSEGLGGRRTRSDDRLRAVAPPLRRPDAVLHGAALLRADRGIPEDTVGSGQEARTARSRQWARHVGSRGARAAGHPAGAGVGGAGVIGTRDRSCSDQSFGL